MPEFTPQITYSPEGILELRKTQDDMPTNQQELFSAHKKKLNNLPGYEITEDALETTVRVEIAEVIHTTKKQNYQSPSAGQLIDNIRPFVGFVGHEDSKDHVFSLDLWRDYGAVGVIYPQFQRWLNLGLDEDVARSCINAMAYPFGAEAIKRAKKEYRYLTDGANTGAGMGGYTFSVTSRHEKFGVGVSETTGEEPVHKNGKVAWNWVDLSTIGDCACWGASWMDRERVYVRPESNRLYKMDPHNVDFAVQSLSLVLGAARLAYEAARYSGDEDILTNAVWDEPRR